MIRLVLLLALALFVPAFAVAQEVKPAAPPAETDGFKQQIVPLLDRYCTVCHGAGRKRGDVDLERFKNEAAALKEPKLWLQVQTLLQQGEMPPRNRQQPNLTEREAINAWINKRVVVGDGKRDPGRVTMRRLNRAEYNNTIRDLFGITFKPADDFPADDVGYGFDNIGDVLSLSPLLMEKYLAAADKIIDEVFRNPEARRRIMILLPTEDNKDETARRIIEPFLRRAYRRPVNGDEVRRITNFVRLAEQQGGDFYDGIKLAVKASLVSPHFLYRIEIDAEPNNPKAVHPITNYELASRLSYFLWSSMPDEELFNVARRGALRRDDVLEAQVKRMLKDPKAQALVENFAGQWLQIRGLKTMTPDTGLYPRWNDGLRAAMQKESELFFEHVLREDRPVLDFLTSDYTYVNEELARHYGLKDVKGSEFRLVSTKGTPRGGVLTQASVLTVTSNPTRTSPVKRGKWILENILGTPPPPPPPNVPELEDQKELTGTLRQRMEQHRANPNCAVCHERMDALGFSFENFDGIGGWRAQDEGRTIDPSGELPGGRKLAGPADLKNVLLSDKDLFVRNLAERLLTYSLGRGTEHYDKLTLDEIVEQVKTREYKFSALVLEIIKSDPFQKRRGYRRETP